MNEVIEPLTNEEVAEIERDYQEHGQYRPLTSQDKRFIRLIALATKNGYERDQLRAELRTKDAEIARLRGLEDGMSEQEYSNWVLKMTSGISKQSLRAQLLTAALGLAGEAGEFADLVKKWCFQGHELPLEDLIYELGDALYYLTLAARAIEYPMFRIRQSNVFKLTERYPDGFTEERSKHRD